MSRLHPPAALAVLVLLASAGCEDRPITAPGPDEAPRGAKAGAPPPQELWTSDDEWARAARAEVPGFAGYYFEDGVPVILLKDHRQREAAERYLAPALAQASRGRNAGPMPRPVVRKVTHDFAELKGWFDQLDGLMLPRADVNSLDVDEVNNRVTIGVRDDAAVQALRREAARLRVPPGALGFKIVGPAVPAIGLRDWTSTLTGGFQIAGPPPPGYTGVCTFGFNAVHQGVWVFVTNSHCTYNPFVMGSTIITQPTYVQGNEIGTEYADRGLYACAGIGTSCRKSDAAYIRHNGSRTIGQGKIAYTQLGYGAPAPLEVLGYYDITRRYTTVAVGDFLDKTGRTSGSTYGQVLEACVTAYQEHSGVRYTLQCQDLSSVWSQGGDSGSPMYVYRYGNAELYGILWGGPPLPDGTKDPNKTYSSRLAGIEQDLGPLTYLCAPAYVC